jgi:hypothetical protein
MNALYAENKGCPVWLSKEPDLFRHVYECALHYPDARFVYLVRDGRDVAASMLKRGVHERDIYKAGKRWRNEQQLSIGAMSDEALRERFFMLRYEDLIADAEGVTKTLMDFLGMPFEASQLEFYRQKSVIEHSKKSEFWKNLSKPVDASNAGKYREFLTERDIRIFENLCWNELSLLGYRPDLDRPSRVSHMDRLLSMLLLSLKRASGKEIGESEVKQRNARNRVIHEILNRTFK